jgi:DNA-binding XRE family transcriptional regulator
MTIVAAEIRVSETTIAHLESGKRRPSQLAD